MLKVWNVMNSTIEINSGEGNHHESLGREK